ncbi:3-hydroxyacyl-CoA dehydrogenase/enoyl-CoA hydratase family protein [Halalkalicoccus sp. NIPERK01]|uniref:3-hydroxyacyl-CoA dehydrogenase/enoyl-CoA hydratase family protein n=1 Tax=Halalkalicoccus sp. NIPERK01 TaxID=3053469 RepID=UPI00256E9D7A|nr:3-hydroxyacyl-CoA dehydrogenase NAD-binding domain-containing protein [Halalkalicoccus sp. NIPERK01]MDL5361575.1 3-hydroxyacyl-CoA dehydrogenase NAD-binding domain-containing protein [Halalkalicoccus sp. NIPERK01]
MTVEEIERVAVLGAGNMGHGIAEVVALSGYDVTMRDVEREFVEDGYSSIEWSLEKLAEKDLIDEDPEGVLSRIEIEVDLEAAVAGADLVIEAAPERMDLKKEIFAELDEYTDDAILATNTSSLSITEIAGATDRPERVCGTHFFNPPVKMDLVEVVYGAETSDETAETASAFVESLGKTPIHVEKDVNGFVVNSVLGPFGDEAGWMVSEGLYGIREVDAAMVFRRNYPMGPFELGDLTGIDVGYHVRTEAGKEVPPIVEEKVEAEELGRKTGKGYYDYESGEGADYERDQGEGVDTVRIEARMINEAAKLIGDEVATPEAIDTGLRLGAGFPEGPCRRADELGLDRVLEKLETLYEESGAARYEPVDYLRELVASGRTGKDAGAGFYEYGDEHDYVTISTTLEGGLLEITLDRPERLNALSREMADEIVHALEDADLDAVRAVTFEGAGDRAFCAGADITGFSGIEPHEKEVTPVHRVVAEFPRPTLAKIEGYCLGGGFELALACDLRIATDGSTFGFPEIDLGLIPGGGGTQRAIRMLPDARAKELVFRGNHIDAERAAEWGLINRAVSEGEFETTVEEFVSDLVEGPPIALRKAKRVMNRGRDGDMEAGLEMESQAFGILLGTEDVAEGTAAFSENREPEFRGE